MTTKDPFVDQLADYLDEYEGFTPLPDSVRDSLRATVARTSQVGAPRGLMRYFGGISKPAAARYGLVAAAVVAGVALGAVLGGRGGNLGADPTPTATPTPTPSSTPSVTLIEPVLIEPGTGEPRALAGGTYSVDAPFPVRLTFEVPRGWEVWAYTSAASQINLYAGGSVEVSFEIVDNVTADPCTPRLLDPPVGPSVDDLVSALSNLEGFEATPATDVTVDGFRGKQLTLTAPDPDRPCQLRTWKTTTRQNGVGPGEVNEVRILNVDGVRLMICVAYTPPISAAARAEIRAVIRSVRIGP
jgi:hypothetical protein